MPDGCCQRVGIADQDPVAVTGGTVLTIALGASDLDELGGDPAVLAVFRQLLLGQLATVFWHPICVEMLGQLLRERGLTGRFRPDQADAFSVIATYRWVEIIPAVQRIRTHRGSRDGYCTPIDVDQHVPTSKTAGEVVT